MHVEIRNNITYEYNFPPKFNILIIIFYVDGGEKIDFLFNSWVVQLLHSNEMNWPQTPLETYT